ERVLEHAGREQLRLVGGGAAVRILERHHLPLLRETEPALDRAGGLGGDGAAAGRSAPADRAAAALEKGDRHAARPAEPGARKSTRLNSSHVSSSYAVFSLKKKT